MMAYREALQKVPVPGSIIDNAIKGTTELDLLEKD